MQRPSTVLFILAIIVLILLLPKSLVSSIFGFAWWIFKVVAIAFAILIIVLYLTKKK